MFKKIDLQCQTPQPPNPPPLEIGSPLIIGMLFEQYFTGMVFVKAHVRPRGRESLLWRWGILIHISRLAWLEVQCHQAQDIWEHLFSIFLEFVNSSGSNYWNLRKLYTCFQSALFSYRVCVMKVGTCTINCGGCHAIFSSWHAVSWTTQIINRIEAHSWLADIFLVKILCNLCTHQWGKKFQPSNKFS